MTKTQWKRPERLADPELVVDRITTVSRTKLGSRLGVLDDSDLVRLNRAVVVFLGIVARS